MQHVITDGLHGGDTNPATDEHEHLVTIAIHVKARSSVRSVQINIDLPRLFHVIVQPLGPVAEDSNVQGDLKKLTLSCVQRDLHKTFRNSLLKINVNADKNHPHTPYIYHIFMATKIYKT